jgi:hypothetical protein
VSSCVELRRIGLACQWARLREHVTGVHKAGRVGCPEQGQYYFREASSRYNAYYSKDFDDTTLHTTIIVDLLLPQDAKYLGS